MPVDIEIPSPKVAIVRFKRGMQQGLLGRISRSCIMEYHAFGIISEGTHAKYHYMICGVQGDFTRSLVNDPPATLWTRELKFAGVSNTSTLYKRGVRICTGTGVGAALSTCIQSPNWFLIWIGSDQEKTFGPTISGLIYRHIPPERYAWPTDWGLEVCLQSSPGTSCGTVRHEGMFIGELSAIEHDFLMHIFLGDDLTQ